MPAPFAKTLRSLRTDRSVARGAALLAAAAVLVPWAIWGARGEVTLRELSVSARIEVDRAATTVGAPRDGRVASVHAVNAVLGRDVAEGDVLLELDGDAVRAEIAAARQRMASVAPRALAIRHEIAAERAADKVHVEAAEKALAESRARTAEAKVQVELAQHQAQLAESLAERNAVPKEQAREARSKADAAAARVVSLESETTRLAAAAEAERADRATRIARLEREIPDLDALAVAESAHIAQLEVQLTDYTVRAPVAGRIGEIAPLRAGSVVEMAQTICVIVPRGTPRVVARFPLRTAGRVRTGQAATLRFDGFAWTRFGTVAATVGTIGTPEADGTFRAELSIDDAGATTIPVAHGLTCTAEVEVERISPLDLAVRSAGRLLTGERDAAAGEDAAGAAPK